MELWIALWAVCAVVGALIYRSKGRPAMGGLIAGGILGPIGVVLALFAPAMQEGKGLKRCPACAEWIQQDATVCRYCQRPV